MDTALEILYWAGGLTLAALLLFFIVAGLLAWKARRRLDALIFGGTEALEEKLQTLRRKFPELSEEELLKKLVAGEALIAGGIGFLTGLGGMVTLPVALPVNILATVKIQSRLIAFLGQRTARAEGADAGTELQNYAILAGAKQVHRVGAKLILKLILRYAPRVVLQALPLVGGLIGFLMDWLTTRGIGRVALARARAN